METEYTKAEVIDLAGRVRRRYFPDGNPPGPGIMHTGLSHMGITVDHAFAGDDEPAFLSMTPDGPVLCAPCAHHLSLAARTMTVGRLLGHLFLETFGGEEMVWPDRFRGIVLAGHGGGWGDPVTRARTRAVWFAAELLMPEDMIRDRFRREVVETRWVKSGLFRCRTKPVEKKIVRKSAVWELASDFGVSELTMDTRIDSLGMTDEYRTYVP